MSILNKTPKDIYKSLILVNDETNGIDTTLERIKDGAGNSSSLRLSKDALEVQPQENDNTTAHVVKSKSGTELFKVDSTNSRVYALQNDVNIQYAKFNKVGEGLTVNTHTCLDFHSYQGTTVTIGTGTNPDTSLSFTSTADDFVNCFMYVMDDITIDDVRVFVSDAGTTSADVRLHLMQYDIDTANGSTSGDISNGVVLADGSDLTGIGYDAIDYQQMTIQSANVDSGKIIVATILKTDVSDKVSVNMQIKYHLR